MTPTLGTLQQVNLAELARLIAPRQGISVFALETARGWLTSGYQGGELIWENETDIREEEPVLTLFGAGPGKLVFQRSTSSSPEAVNQAVKLLRTSRSTVYQKLQGAA
jgi:hypothetical protein